MNKKMRVLSIILALVTVSCFLFALGATAFAADANGPEGETANAEKQSVNLNNLLPGFLKVTNTTIEFHQTDTDCEYKITTMNGQGVNEYTDWIAPKATALIFEGLESNTTYIIQSRIAADKTATGTMMITTAQTLNLLPLIIVLGLILIYELGINVKRVNGHKKAGSKMFALAPIFLLGVYIPATAVVIVLAELVLIAVATILVININIPEKASSANDNVEVIVVKSTEADEEARKAAEEARQAAEEALRVAEEARKAAEEEAAARKAAEEEAARKAAEEEAARKAAEEEAARKAAEEEAARKAAEEEAARKAAEEEAARKAAEEEAARKAAEEEAARKAAEEEAARKAAEEEAARKAAEEEAARKAAEEEAARKAAEEEARKVAEEMRIAAEEARKAAEELRRLAEEEAARIAAEEAARKAAEEEAARIAAEEEAQRLAAEEAARIAAEEEAARIAAEEAQKKADAEEAALKAAKAAMKAAEEARAAAEAARKAAAVSAVATETQPTEDKKSSIINTDDTLNSKVAFDERGLPITPEGMVIRYKWSALSRLYNAPDELRYYYLVLRRLLMSYKKVRSNISWNFDSYFLGRKQLAKLKIRGKALMVYLAFDPKEMEGTKYRGKDVSKFSTYKQVPFCYRVNGKRKLNYAMELIRQLMADTPCVEPEYVSLAQIGEAIPYADFETLFLEGLLKIGMIAPATGKAISDDDDDDDIDDDNDIDESDDDDDDNEEIAAHTATGPVAREEFNFTVPAEKKRTAPVMEKVSATEAKTLMTDEEAKEALYDLTKPAEPAPAEETAPVVEETPAVEETATVAETTVEETATAVEEAPAVEEPAPVVEAPAPVKSARDRKPPKKSSKKSNAIALVNIDDLDRSFNAGDLINLATLKEKGMVPNNTAHVKILARGTLTKPLTVCAGQFSMDAVKMIFLVGGKAVKTLED